MPVRLLLLAIGLAFTGLALIDAPVPNAASQAPRSPTVISGGDLPHPVRLAAADTDAFFRRLDPPPEPEEAPPATGQAYRVTSSYWDFAVHLRDEERPQADEEATYYPATGYARARLDGEDVWLLLDQRQRALLDRYIRLVRDGSIGPEPGVFEVVRAAARTELVGVTVGPLQLNAEQEALFWQESEPVVLSRDRIPPIEPYSWLPEGDIPTPWVLLTLPEGRSVELVYGVASGVLLDRFATEFYPVPARWLVPVLGPVADIRSADYGLSPLPVKHDESRGSRTWWAAMIGLGIAAIATALILRLRGSTGD